MHKNNAPVRPDKVKKQFCVASGVRMCTRNSQRPLQRMCRYPVPVCRWWLLALVLIIYTPSSMATELSDLADFSLEQLADVKVTSVSRQSERLSEAAASVYVITHEDIVRSGVTTLPEALRLAPGVEVARKGSYTWSISLRGFNNNLSNKLLVLIDGRSVYSPLYAGVFWDVQDTLLEDVDRIEIISGPGGTLWGSNAVNGVINIITRSSADTRGGYVELGGGNEQRAMGGFRYDGRLGKDVSARAYFKYTDTDASRLPGGGSALDYWHMSRGGFRMDWGRGKSDAITLEGNAYTGKEHGRFRGDFTLGTLPGNDQPGFVDLAGFNLLGRWSRTLDSGSSMSLQAYYDYTKRDIPSTYGETRHTFDLDFQDQLTLLQRNDIVWGAGFRLSSDRLDNTYFATFEPSSRTDLTFSGFVQDKIDLWSGRLFLTLGSKFEHNDYTGFEYQPNARLSWLVSDRQTIWAAVSRAVRVPSRLDADLRLIAPFDVGVPLYVTVNGSHDFKAEELLAYEAGYRIQPLDNLSLDMAAFYNNYDRLETTEPGTPSIVPSPPLFYIILPATLFNGMKGETYGGTLTANWKPVPGWRLELQYSYLDIQLHHIPASRDTAGENIEGQSPENQVSLHSYVDLPHNLSLYTGLRYVDKLPSLGVNSYLALDISLLWQPLANVEFSLSGRNLADRNHLEYGGSNLVERSVYGKIVWRF